jgi:hypothetical protein
MQLKRVYLLDAANEHAANERPRPQLRQACEAAARSRERASREATAEFEDDGLHSIHMLSPFEMFRHVSFASCAWEVRKVARDLASLRAATPALQFVSSYLTMTNVVFSKRLSTRLSDRQ